MVLDTEVTPELAAEGLARDLVRQVQQARRDAGLAVSDRIALTIAGPAAVQDAARTHERLIAAETLATWSRSPTPGDAEPTVEVRKAEPSRRRWAPAPAESAQRSGRPSAPTRPGP